MSPFSAGPERPHWRPSCERQRPRTVDLHRRLGLDRGVAGGAVFWGTLMRRDESVALRAAVRRWNIKMRLRYAALVARAQGNMKDKEIRNANHQTRPGR